VHERYHLKFPDSLAQVYHPLQEVYLVLAFPELLLVQGVVLQMKGL